MSFYFNLDRFQNIIRAAIIGVVIISVVKLEVTLFNLLAPSAPVDLSGIAWMFFFVYGLIVQLCDD